MRTARSCLIVIAAAGGLLLAGSPAIAAEAGPAATAQDLTGQPLGSALQADPFHICLKNASSYCLRFVTAGNQETITNNSANYGNFHIAGSDGRGDYQIENGSGNCLRAANDHIVKIKDGGCVDSSGADFWYAPANHPYRVQSLFYGDDMLVHGTVNGFNVWHEIPQSGDWDNWARG